MSMQKHAVRPSVQAPPSRRRSAGPDRRGRSRNGNESHRFRLPEACGRRGETCDPDWFADDDTAATDASVGCRLLDPDFDGLDEPAGVEIGRWFGCPGATAATDREE
jgi:hypothetical protein